MGYTSPSENFVEYVRQAIMPVIIISFGPLSSIARQVRTNMLEVINQDYIRTARANGIREGSVKYRHALKNSLIPVITLVALQVLIMTSVMNKDYLTVQATTFVISLFVVICNFLLDIAYGIVDPRIRLSAGKRK